MSMLQCLFHFNDGVAVEFISDEYFNNSDEFLQKFFLDESVFVTELYQLLRVIVVVHNVTLLEFDLVDCTSDFDDLQRR